MYLFLLQKRNYYRMSEEEANTRVDQTQPHLDKVSSVTERVVLSKLEKESLTKEEWAQKWLTMELYVNQLEDRLAASEGSRPVNWCFFNLKSGYCTG